MDSDNLIHVLVAIRLPALARYREALLRDPRLKPQIVTSLEMARGALNDPTKTIDVLVIDNNLGDVFSMVRDLRQTHPRLLILLVDEEADFSMPGRADDVTTEPFKDDEMLKKIKRMTEDRRLQTLRADALPPVRNFAKALRKAVKGAGKQQAAVDAISDLGYDHVAFYAYEAGETPALALGAQVGDATVAGALPERVEYGAGGVLTHVARTGESRIFAAGDTHSHFLVERGRFESGIAVAVGVQLRFGVILAFRAQAASIKQENLVMLELVSAQLASSLAKEGKS
jgi:DNA-binding response OmpR family regulator